MTQTSAEYFLEAGYAVLFLYLPSPFAHSPYHDTNNARHRQFSLLPFSRHYSHSTDCFLDFLKEGPNGSVVARDDDAAKMLDVLRKYRHAREANRLLVLPFVSISDYLHELRSIAQLMNPLGPRGLLYLAAAVSDFFVPVRPHPSLRPHPYTNNPLPARPHVGAQDPIHQRRGPRQGGHHRGGL